MRPQSPGADGDDPPERLKRDTVHVIELDQVMPMLLEACPSFTKQWAISEVENGPDDSGKRLHYIDAGDFVQHIVELQLVGQLDEFPAVFDALERLLLEGDPQVRNLAAVGYIEGFQMLTVTRRGLDPEADFRPWMRPASQAIWDELNLAWETLALRGRVRTN